NTNRTALNALLRSSFVAQAPSLYLADPASDPVFVDGVQNNSPNTYYGDWIHPTPAGYDVMAPYFAAAIRAATPAPAPPATPYAPRPGWYPRPARRTARAR